MIYKNVFQYFFSISIYLCIILSTASASSKFCKNGKKPFGEDGGRCNDNGECEEGAPEGYSCDIPVQGGSQEYCCDISDVKKGLESDDDSLPSPDRLKENLKERFGSNSDSSDSDDDSFDTEENIERRTGRSDEESEDFGDSEDSDGERMGDTEFGRTSGHHDRHHDHHRHHHGSTHGSREEGRIPSCKDTNLHCLVTAQLCIVEWAFERMAEHCPKTCNRCPGDLIDVADNCAHNAIRCHNPADRDLLAWQCPRTCRYTLANRPVPSSRAFNNPQLNQQNPLPNPVNPYENLAACAGLRDDASCYEWQKNGFCDNQYYPTAHKKQFCPVMCKLCGATV
ncbi:hypothetical protein DdX_15124 [Ditylenchus destructor]|uniref:ShKT domain-containing protein n=1 Tax=Ditylenchus destructor TaxID=166010 RepID=A0AAD4R1A5_9BILA|nr:hypothetical protein DdX_15124 [Ditylenchus destructor]